MKELQDMHDTFGLGIRLQQSKCRNKNISLPIGLLSKYSGQVSAAIHVLFHQEGDKPLP